MGRIRSLIRDRDRYRGINFNYLIMENIHKAIKRAAAQYIRVKESMEHAYIDMNAAAEMNGYTVNKDTGKVTRLPKK